jgi:Transcription factor WhiB
VVAGSNPVRLRPVAQLVEHFSGWYNHARIPPHGDVAFTRSHCLRDNNIAARREPDVVGYLAHTGLNPAPATSVCAVHRPFLKVLAEVRAQYMPKERIGCNHDHVLVAEQLDELAHRVPNLPGAACKGRPSTFDVADRHDPKIEAAQAICRTCPALRDCRTWLDGLPRSERPSGIVAGRYIAPPRPSA